MPLVILSAVVLVFISTGIHFSVLRSMTHLLPKLESSGRIRIAYLVLFVLLIHLLEITLFAATYYYFDIFRDVGQLQGNLGEGFTGFFYYSAVTFTTLGYGDISPVGPIRLLASVEALVGLLLSAWSASVIFLFMQRYWHMDQVKSSQEA